MVQLAKAWGPAGRPTFTQVVDGTTRVDNHNPKCDHACDISPRGSPSVGAEHPPIS